MGWNAANISGICEVATGDEGEAAESRAPAGIQKLETNL